MVTYLSLWYIVHGTKTYWLPLSSIELTIKLRLILKISPTKRLFISVKFSNLDKPFRSMLIFAWCSFPRHNEIKKWRRNIYRADRYPIRSSQVRINSLFKNTYLQNSEYVLRIKYFIEIKFNLYFVNEFNKFTKNFLIFNWDK